VLQSCARPRRSRVSCQGRSKCEVATMTRTSFSAFLSTLLILGLTAGARAQGTQQGINANSYRGGYSSGYSRPPSYGYGVPTGRGPLTQPIGPPAGSWYRSYGRQTYPSPSPYGN